MEIEVHIGTDGDGDGHEERDRYSDQRWMEIAIVKEKETEVVTRIARDRNKDRDLA